MRVPITLPHVLHLIFEGQNWWWKLSLPPLARWQWVTERNAPSAPISFVSCKLCLSGRAATQSQSPAFEWRSTIYLSLLWLHSIRWKKLGGIKTPFAGFWDCGEDARRWWLVLVSASDPFACVRCHCEFSVPYPSTLAMHSCWNTWQPNTSPLFIRKQDDTEVKPLCCTFWITMVFIIHAYCCCASDSIHQHQNLHAWDCFPSLLLWVSVTQEKTKGQQLKGKIVS